MKIAIYGAGAAGCTLAVPLFKQGHEVTLIARGRHLQALKENGLRYTHDDGEEIYPIPATDDAHLPPNQDLVFIMTKAYSHEDIAPSVPEMCHEDTLIIPACNGLPWWFMNIIKTNENNRLNYEGTVSKHISSKAILGAVIYMGATYEAPGHVSHLGRQPKIMVGEPEGGISERLERVGHLLEQAGFHRPVTEDIRAQIVIKLGWNVAFNPLSVIYGMNSIEMVEDKAVEARARAIMAELQQVVDALGINAVIPVEKHVELSRRAGAHKPSMLQDYESGKPLEHQAIIGNVLLAAEAYGVKTPEIQSVYDAITHSPDKAR